MTRGACLWRRLCRHSFTRTRVKFAAFCAEWATEEYTLVLPSTDVDHRRFFPNEFVVRRHPSQQADLHTDAVFTPSALRSQRAGSRRRASSWLRTNRSQAESATRRDWWAASTWITQSTSTKSSSRGRAMRRLLEVIKFERRPGFALSFCLSGEVQRAQSWPNHALFLKPVIGRILAGSRTARRRSRSSRIPIPFKILKPEAVVVLHKGPLVHQPQVALLLSAMPIFAAEVFVLFSKTATSIPTEAQVHFIKHAIT
jgi:hypothetical protein